MGRVVLRLDTDLAGIEHAADLPNHWFVAAEVCLPLEHEAEVVAEIIPFVLAAKFDREPDDSVLPRRELHEPSAQRARGYDVLRDIIEVEENAR